MTITDAHSSSPGVSAKTALVVGATSSMSDVLCRALARRGYHLLLAARDEHELNIRASDVRARFSVPCTTLVMDFMAPDFHAEAFITRAGRFDILFLLAGDMGNGKQDDMENLAYVTQANYVVPSQILSASAHAMYTRGGGKIAVVGSVAGDRGRASNYEYGAAKAALAAFASGLRQRYAAQGVHVMTVKPGFTDTPMTWGMKSPLMASREKVVDAILLGLDEKKDVVYAPWFWRFIMLIICHIPEGIFKKLRL